ncbi:ubiquitin-like domain-containing protein [Jeotgalibacillus marinus]|uniref:Ubiquitin-like domain-containing protein n=1 Tax=Jeotgalibacillus marinus TaxID=86667 RepID=A0ABV3Q6G2_9BACL
MQLKNNMKNLFPKSMSKRNWVNSLVTITLFVVVVSFLFHEGTKKTVTLSLNGEEQLVRTHASTVKDIFQELELDLQTQDYLSPSGDSAVYHDMKVRWREAKQVSFDIGKETQQLMTTAETVEEFLRKQKIKIGDHDELSHDLKDKIEENMTISLDQAFAWTLVDGLNDQEVWSTSITVADFLKQHNIKLKKDDRIEPALNTTLVKGASVTIIRVEKVTDVLEETKDFAVETRKDEDLTTGTEEVIQEGEEGLIEKTYEIVMENEKEISRELISEKTVKESKNEVVSVGTKVVADVSRGTKATQTASEGTEMYVSSTAYTSYCNGCSGITTTGINLKANPNVKVIAVDPSVIPLGSEVYVEGYGYAIAADTGGAVKGNKIDVFIPTQEEAYRWGNRRVLITVLP